MKYAVISDVHSNLEALSVALDEIRKREVSKVICLGDVVGYNANPNECCDIVRGVCDCIVLGNHDAGSVGLHSLSHFNTEAREACVWTSRVLTPENTKWLNKLSIKVTYEDFLIIHSGPSIPEHWNYIWSLDDAVNEFLFFKEICFIGHTHVPVTFVKIPYESGESRYNIITKNKFILKAGHQYLINPGSVGQSRDGDIRTSFAIYDSELKEVEIIRLNYDINGAQKKILDAGLPEYLSNRLLVGQ